MQSRDNVMLRALGFVVIVAVGMATSYATMLLNDRDIPVVVLHSEALNSPLHAGDTLRVKYVVRRFRSCHTHIDRQIFDSSSPPTRFVLADLDFPAGFPTGDDAYVTLVDVPLDVKPGVATYRVLAEYKCNIFHTLRPIAAPARDVPFIVLQERDAQ